MRRWPINGDNYPVRAIANQGGRRPNRNTHHARTAADGFVLPLTLWIIALMGLAVAAINTWVSTAVENARALKLKVNDELVMANFTNELVFDLGSRAKSYRGLELGSVLDDDETQPSEITDMMAPTKETTLPVSFDGRPYIMESDPDYVIQLYDARGMLNLNSVQTSTLQRFLDGFGVSQALRDELPDTLTDWIDEDDLVGVAGAEKTDYERLSRHPPSNAKLVTPLEAQSILGWDQVPAMWDADMQTPLFTTCTASGLNPNTAPEATLMSFFPGMTKENAALVMAARAKKPFQSIAEFTSVAGVLVPTDAFFMTLVPGECVVVDLTNRDTNQRIRFSLTLVRLLQGQPWQVDYAFHIPSRYRQKIDGIDTKDTFPTPETINSGDQGSQGPPGLQ